MFFYAYYMIIFSLESILLTLCYRFDIDENNMTLRDIAYDHQNSRMIIAASSSSSNFSGTTSKYQSANIERLYCVCHVKQFSLVHMHTHVIYM